MTKDGHLCFICGNDSGARGSKLIETRTASSGALLPSKLGDVVGNEFLVVVSSSDEVCRRCLALFDRLDELERDLASVRLEVIQLLGARYQIAFDDRPCSEFKGGLDSSKTGTGNFDDRDTPKSGASDTESVRPDRPDVSGLSVKEQCMNVKNYLETFEIDYQESDPSEYKSATNIAHGEDSHVPFENEDAKSYRPGGQIPERGVDVKNDVTESRPKIADDVPSETGDPPSLMYKCSKCDFKDREIGAVEEHFRKHAEKKTTHVCRVCDTPFLSSSLLGRHSRVHERSKGPAECTVCGLRCHDSLHLLYHHRNEHSPFKSHDCVLCRRVFESKNDLKNHLLSVHPNERKFACSDCGTAFNRRTQFENHRLYAHGNQKCRFCGKQIQNDVKLRQHENRHVRIDSKKFDCDKCGRSFKSPGGLRVHKVSHTGDYKFFCEFCGRGFMSGVLLEEHRGVHTREERYVCDACGRKFVLYSTFHLHKQWHRDPYPFPCSLCDRKFKYRSERSNHARKCHTGERPHKCPRCPAEFFKASCLRRHLPLHTNQYPYNCAICSKGFDQRRGLGRHLARVHKDMSFIGPEPKKCEYKVALRPDEYMSYSDKIIKPG